MKRVLCWLGVHDWEITAWSSRTIWLCHLSRLAGCRAACRWCGKEWDDIPADYVLSEPPG